MQNKEFENNVLIHFVNLLSLLFKYYFIDRVRFQEYVRILLILSKVSTFLNIYH